MSCARTRSSSTTKMAAISLRSSFAPGGLALRLEHHLDAGSYARRNRELGAELLHERADEAPAERTVAAPVLELRQADAVVAHGESDAIAARTAQLYADLARAARRE